MHLCPHCFLLAGSSLLPTRSLASGAPRSVALNPTLKRSALPGCCAVCRGSCSPGPGPLTSHCTFQYCLLSVLFSIKLLMSTRPVCAGGAWYQTPKTQAYVPNFGFIYNYAGQTPCILAVTETCDSAAFAISQTFQDVWMLPFHLLRNSFPAALRMGCKDFDPCRMLHSIPVKQRASLADWYPADIPFLLIRALSS